MSSQNPTDFKYSVVIPVYKSADIIDKTIERTVNFFEGQGWNYEIVLINDASPDNSWDKLFEHAAQNPNIVAINLLKNYGQHTAIFCGFHYVSGDYIITMDDDLQNPPEEITHLVHKVLEGYDIVYGKFEQKQHAGYRRLGSKLIAEVNQRVFNQPSDLVVTNYRILEKSVIERIINYRTAYPYITGLSLMFSNKRANVVVKHLPREIGKSGYNWYKLLALVMRIIFNYSSYPLRVVSGIGFGVALIAFMIGIYYFVRAFFVGTNVPGWATLVILLSFFNGINIVIISMLSEYVIRLVQQLSSNNVFYVRSVLNHDK